MIATRQLVSVFQQPQMRLKIPLTMEEVIGSIDAEITDVEEALLQQIGAREVCTRVVLQFGAYIGCVVQVPFAGMDKSGRGVCLKHVRGMCTMNLVCPLRHIVGDKAVVCKHWLRGLCKKVLVLPICLILLGYYDCGCVVAQLEAPSVSRIHPHAEGLINDVLYSLSFISSVGRMVAQSKEAHALRCQIPG